MISTRSAMFDGLNVKRRILIIDSWFLSYSWNLSLWISLDQLLGLVGMIGWDPKDIEGDSRWF